MLDALHNALAGPGQHEESAIGCIRMQPELITSGYQGNGLKIIHRAREECAGSPGILFFALPSWRQQNVIFRRSLIRQSRLAADFKLFGFYPDSRRTKRQKESSQGASGAYLLP
jgi:hypothetical protein